MAGKLVGTASGSTSDTSTDPSSRAGAGTSAPLPGAASRLEGPVELSYDPEHVLVKCDRCGCECYDYHRGADGKVECLLCVANDRDALTQRIEALNAQFATIRRELERVVDLYLADAGRVRR